MNVTISGLELELKWQKGSKLDYVGIEHHLSDQGPRRRGGQGGHGPPKIKSGKHFFIYILYILSFTFDLAPPFLERRRGPCFVTFAV